MDQLLNREELSRFMRMAEGCEVSADVYSWLLATFDAKPENDTTSVSDSLASSGDSLASSVDREDCAHQKSRLRTPLLQHHAHSAFFFQNGGGLTADGLVECYKFMFVRSGCNENTIWRDLLYMGYDEQLNLINARTVVVSVHSEQGAVDLDPLPSFDPQIFEAAIELPVKKNGKAQDLSADGGVRLYVQKAGYSGIALAVENNLSSTIRATVDCSDSVNAVSHRGSDLYGEEIIAPGEMQVVHFLMPNGPGKWKMAYKAGFEQLADES
jgi:hypothetical protein